MADQNPIHENITPIRIIPQSPPLPDDYHLRLLYIYRLAVQRYQEHLATLPREGHEVVDAAEREGRADDR